MRRPTLRTRDLLILVLLVALSLAWGRRRARHLRAAEAHRASRRSFEELAARRSWWSRDRDRELHARQGRDHAGAGWNCLECLDGLGPAHGRAAEAHQAAAWFPWKSIPDDLVALPDPGDGLPRPIGVLRLPEE